MRFMPIVPVHHMQLLDDWDSLFVLPELMLNRDYYDYVTSRSWNLVIVENGFYELGEALSIRYLERVADCLEADTKLVVGPETSDGKVTLIKCALAPKTKYPMIVILKDGEKLWRRGVQFGLSHIGLLSKQAPHEGTKTWYLERIKMVSHIKGLNPDVYIHAFGCDTLGELLALKKAGADSCDSSFPCSRAVAGVSMEERSPRIDLYTKYSEEAEMRRYLSQVKQALGDNNESE